MIQIKDLHQHVGQTIDLNGWITHRRVGGKVAFMVLRDGSGYCQCVIDASKVGAYYDEIKRLTQESAVKFTGEVVKDERQVGGYELHVNTVHIYHIAEEYPISNKEHGADFLIRNRHLWLRSKRQWAILRIRNRTKYAIHTFFQERGFIQTDAPILTGNAAEGTTELFETQFYEEGVSAYLSQSGQLYAEATAMAHGKVYTFGPCFRAEKSLTPRHLSEFWMIEPEMAFYDLDMDMDLIQEFVQYIVNDIRENCKTELEALERDMGLFENINKPFPRITFEDAGKVIRGHMDWDGKNAIALQEADLAEVLEKLETTRKELAETEAIVKKGGLKKGKMNYFRNKADKLKGEVKKLEEDAKNIPQWIESAKNFPEGEDFGSPHERVLTRLFDTPVFVYKWPKNIKAFYMKTYDDDPDYVKGCDLLAPEGFGEVVGGSEREYDLDVLLASIRKHGLPEEVFEWYTDLRRYGSVPHSGFGLGFERTVMWLSGAKHIRETIPFARYYGRLFP
ncbi:MAG: asparagine--tRNA ligase [Chitinophagales bacterium]